ncbi:hypothetical protein GCM10020000_53130 [Streptomyces olivoverticillatus]
MSNASLDGTLHGRFLRGLARAPHRPAFRIDGHETTYAEAHEQALAWAGALRDATPGGAPRVVAVVATKSAEAYTGLLAALYLGATAVPPCTPASPPPATARSSPRRAPRRPSPTRAAWPRWTPCSPRTTRCPSSPRAPAPPAAPG